MSLRSSVVSQPLLSLIAAPRRGTGHAHLLSAYHCYPPTDHIMLLSPGQLSNHQQDCPKAPVSCQFHRHGCTFKVFLVQSLV